ncbi:MAG: diphosphomevalonate decarboxylase [Anaerolineales bacterium]
MGILSSIAIAHPNIALIKYWGDMDQNLHIPANGSISMNLAELHTGTTVSFDPSTPHDRLWINGEENMGNSLERVSSFLNRVRQMAGIATFATVDSQSNFPMSAGLASSASAFAALSLAASRAAGLRLDERELSRLARIGSGSACRSIPGGFVEWQAGHNDEDSYAYSIVPPEYWDLVDCIALVSQEEKTISSSTGHSLASTSPIQSVRLADTPRRLKLCREAIIERDFDKLAEVVELDSNLMHTVMITSSPPLLYWQGTTVTIMQAVQSWRKAGLQVCYTIDAGPNVHVLCRSGDERTVAGLLRQLPGISQVIVTHPGGPASFIEGDPHGD